MGQSNDRGDGGIYIGSIMKGGAVAADGRIEPGDMLLQVGPCPKSCCSALPSHHPHGLLEPRSRMYSSSGKRGPKIPEICDSSCGGLRNDISKEWKQPADR